MRFKRSLQSSDGRLAVCFRAEWLGKQHTLLRFQERASTIDALLIFFTTNGVKRQLLFASNFHDLVDQVNQRAELLMRELHCAQHHVFRHALCSRLDHQGLVFGPSDDEVELAFFGLLIGWK